MSLYSFTYSIPYIISAIFLLFAYQYEHCKQTSNITIKIEFLFLLIFIGLRGHLYTDFINYYPFYNEVPSLSSLTWSYIENCEFDIGFIIYSSLFKTFLINYYIWIFINTLIDLLILIYVFRRYSQSVALSFFFFFCFMGLLIEINLLRNVKAIMIFLLSLPYLEKRKMLPYMLLNFLGATLHSSALLYLPAYFILNLRFHKFVICIMFGIVNIAFFLKFSIISNVIYWISELNISSRGIFMLRRYLDNSENEYSISLGYIERSINYLLFFVFYNRLAMKKKTNLIFCNCYFIYYFLFYITSEVKVLAERTPLLFVFSYWFLYPNLIVLLKKKVYINIIILFCLFKLSISTNSIINKYDNWLLGGIASYRERAHIYLNNPQLW